MSKNTPIEWADHTFNPWEGCQKVGPGCDHCYAETRNARFGGGTAVNWGPGAPRRRTSAANWRKPLAWNAAHADFYATHGHRQRVFCASLADVFDNAVDPQWRFDLMRLIEQTPNLDWLLLTKRIGNAAAMLDEAVLAINHGRWNWRDNAFPNVWLGATIVNQEEADRDIPKLLDVPAARRFLSMEPLLGPVDFAKVPGFNRIGQYLGNWWVIVGGESGAGARPMHPDWVRGIRDQCRNAGVPFLFKQHGEWLAAKQERSVLGNLLVVDGAAPFSDRPKWHHFDDGTHMARVGKRAAGRQLDGLEHNGFPEAQ